MNKMTKSFISAVAALGVTASVTPVMPIASAAENSFDAQTVMWTNRTIEDVLAETGKYKTVKDVDPNAAKSTDSLNIQTPYGKPNEYYQSWAYSEFIWTNFYPIGNGRMAGMVAGGIDNEVIQINEDTCWDGGPYGDLVDENGNAVTNITEAQAAEDIHGVNMTSGTRKDGWKYYRGADEDGNPAPIGSADALVGDETFRANYPDFANKSISNQSLAVDNSSTTEAVQQRYYLAGMVEGNFLGVPSGQRAYKSFVEVYLDFGHDSKNASNYTKSLDMKTGIVTVEYDYDGGHYKRENFASYPDQTVVTHVESDKDLNFSAQLHTYHNQNCTYTKISDKEVKVDAFVTDGNNNSTVGRRNVIRFESRMYLDGDGAFSVPADNTTVTVNGGKSATIYVVGATNYVDYKTLDGSKPAGDCAYYMDNVKSKTYAQIKERHITDFQPEFEKTSLNIKNTESTADYGSTPTEKRVRKNLSSGKSGFTVGTQSTLSAAKNVGVTSTYADGDNQLAALMFNYGKYLILAGARDGRAASGEGEINIPESQPLNLTGKWNAAMSASWNGKYTININTEMNYWAAQPLNIAESERTLIDTFADLAESGSITAAEQYGIFNERGDDTYQPGDPWVMHHNYDLWRGTQPIDNATAGLWPTGGVWLLDHAWQYYQFNKDKEYLAEVYPYMVGAAKFFTQFLVIDPQTGYLITAASCSPEQGSVQPGPAMDTQLVRNLYDTIRQASKILGRETEDAALLAKIDEQMPSSYLADEQGKLAPSIIDDSGFIKEWARGDVKFDFTKSNDDEVSGYPYQNIQNPWATKDEEKVVSIKEHEANNHGGHRHCSHLWEMYPGTHLSAYSTDANEKKLFDAYAKTVSAKGVGDRSWAYAWRMALNARALNAAAADTSFETLITTKTSPNLFTQHPNFQIDGNYGATAAIVEMLVQSHDDAIDLLPALPDKWAEGSVEGINTRQNAIVDITWADNKPTEAKIYAKADGDINVRSKYTASAAVYDKNGNAVEAKHNADNNMLTFAVNEGETYTITDFGSNVIEGDVTYKASDITEFYASDGGSAPKLANDNTEVGYLYRRDGVKIGYAVEDFDFDGLTKVILKMAKVRNSNTYAIITLDSPTGTEIANQLISTGDNELELKNTSGVNGTHKIYVLFIQNPYDESSTDKYLGNASDIVASYSKAASKPDTTSNPIAPTANPTEEPSVEPSDEPSDYEYTIKSAKFTDDGKLNVTLEGKSNAARLIAAAYNEGGSLTKVLTKDVDGSAELNIDFAKPSGGTVKLMVWDGLDTMKPLSAVYNVRLTVSEVSTPIPTAAPTATNTPAATGTPAATAAPTTTDAPTGVYIGATMYSTVTEAVSAASVAAPSSETDRIYIDIMPGVYREQVVVKTPYVTLRKKADTEGEVKLTWYYGLGTLYDSCNSSGYYDPSVIGDGEAYGPKDWGPSLKVDKTATGFIAENITIENSYNSYYTEEELTDIAGVDPDTNNSMFQRLAWIQDQKANNVSDDEINAYLQSRKNITFGGYTGSPRERCAALHCSADKAQFINCTVMSTQDTIGINTGRMYFKNCKLGGTTDYICGSATAVFDGCELYTNAGPKQAESATITAPANGADAEGYLFLNCKITGSGTSTTGSMGRPWGAAPGPAAYYINTTINDAASGGGYLVSSAGWSDMSSNKAEDARFGEYGSVDKSGSPIDMSGRVKGKVLTEWTMLRFNPYTFTKGSDGWDPAGMAATYSGVDGVIASTTIDTSDGSTNEITLPEAPVGYEFAWESNSEFAQVSSDGTKITLIRPAYGEDAIKATVKLYARESANTEIGAEKSIEFEIEPTSDTTNVFSVSGTVSMSASSEEAQTVKLELKKGDAVIKTQTVEIPAGETSVQYSMENIPEGSYTIYPSAENGEYNVLTESQEITGTVGATVTYDVVIKKMVTITVESGDFSASGYTPSITSATGFSAGVYTATGSETANLGAGNVVYKLTKDENSTLAKNVGVSFDIKSMLQNGSSFDNTKTIKFGFDLLMESIDYLPSDYTYFDLATSTSNGGNGAADQTRFVRWGVYKGWKQLNFFDALNNRINGDKTQFDKNNTMANRWYRIVGDIDLITKTITTTIYDRDKDMEILNGKAFNIAVPDENCDSPSYPANIDLTNLYFNVYMDSKANTTNKLEYYIDNITLEYQDYE